MLKHINSMSLTLCSVAFCSFANVSMAQDSLDTAALAETVAQACMFETIDFDAEYAALTSAFADGPLPSMMEQEKTQVFGDMSATHIIVSRKIDELACFMRMPAPLGSKDVFTEFETALDSAIDAAFPKHLEEKDTNPSPHIEGHDWVASFPGKMHYAVALDWGTETGLQLAVGFRQLYE